METFDCAKCGETVDAKKRIGAYWTDEGLRLQTLKPDRERVQICTGCAEVLSAEWYERIKEL